MSTQAGEVGGNISDISIDEYRADLERLSLNLAALVDQPLIIPKAHKVVSHHWKMAGHGTALVPVAPVPRQATDRYGPARKRRIIRLENPGLNAETVDRHHVDVSAVVDARRNRASTSAHSSRVSLLSQGSLLHHRRR